MKNLVIKETAKSKTNVKNLSKVVKEARNKKEGTILGINFKTIGKTIVMF